MNFGFIRAAAAIPSVKVADPSYNVAHMACLAQEAARRNAGIIVFPELSVTGYTCGDLFLQSTLLDAAQAALGQLLADTRPLNLVCIVGLPVRAGGVLLNVAVVFYKGKICGVVPKTHLPNYKEFQEDRYFTSAADWLGAEVTLCGQTVPAGPDLVFEACGVKFGVEICEDLWAPIAPSAYLAVQGAELIFNLSASNELAGKHRYLRALVQQQSARCLCGYVYSSCGFGESSTDLVFGGNAFAYENGHLLACAQRFETGPQLALADIDVERLKAERLANTTFAHQAALAAGEAYDVVQIPMQSWSSFDLARHIEKTPFVPQGPALEENCSEVLRIQTLALSTRLAHTKVKTAVIGVSGGLDSTLALLVCCRAMDALGRPRKEVLGVTMPGFGTTGRTYQNALQLMKALGVSVREISIKDACLQHFKEIGHNPSTCDITYENAQARERTQILMNLANQTGGLVVGTGDLSELALGWATYNGDHMSMYGVNAGVPKTLARALVAYAAHLPENAPAKAALLDVADTPVSPELLPSQSGLITQCTEDVVGPYELHDFFIYYFLRFGFGPAKIYFLAQKAFAGAYTKAVIKKWLSVFFSRFFAQQFKRSCLPDGPKVGAVGLSPRGDWRMPSDASCAAWMHELEKLK